MYQIVDYNLPNYERVNIHIKHLPYEESQFRLVPSQNDNHCGIKLLRSRVPLNEHCPEACNREQEKNYKRKVVARR